MKSSISFVCQECGYDTPQWMGKCPECGNWNTLKEFQISNTKSQISNKRNHSFLKGNNKPRTLDEIGFEEKERITTGFSEMDVVLGGGIVRGSVILLAGDPGIGKSTLLLQTALNICSSAEEILRSAQNDNAKVLYVSAEESEEQIKLRAGRVVKSWDQQKNLLLISLSDTDQIGALIEEIKPALVIIDSIQMMESVNLEGLSGAVGQVRYAAGLFIKIAKSLNIPFILVGHVTKEGMVAGPMVLSHMVDTVLFLEGEKFTNTRLLRSFKNRFGPVDEVGVFSMDALGISQSSPEKIFLDNKGEDKKSMPGSVLTVVMEGTRPFLIEIQALVASSKLPFPRRVSLGIDFKRLELLIAVLQKHCKIPLDSMDVFVNVAGGLKVKDPAVDLGICLAVFSSFRNLNLGKIVGISEVGLLGELRNVSMIGKRVKQAKKLGFDKIITAETNRYLNEVIALFK